MRFGILLVILAVIAVTLGAVAGEVQRGGGKHSIRLGHDLGDDPADPWQGGKKGGKSDDDSDDESDDENGDDTVCARSAAKMLESCGFEIHEQYHATVASCINISNLSEQAECVDGAEQAREEDAEGCHDQAEARLDLCEMLGEDFYDPDPLTDDGIDFIDPNDIGDSRTANPYFSLEAGYTYVLRAGEGFEETIVVHVTDEVREILGVDCRIVVDIVVLIEDGEYEAVEVTDDFYAQSGIGDIYYCGEVARNFENGLLINLDGSFEAGLDFAKSGVLIMADPVPGFAHRQEYKLGEAEDAIRYVGLNGAPPAEEGGENPVSAFDCGMNGGCVKTEEFIPGEPSSGEYKYFLAGEGFVLGVGLEDGVPSGDRDELLCSGGSLAVLDDPACGIADVPALKEVLCELSRAFCED